jgi:hypothetical protein
MQIAFNKGKMRQKGDHKMIKIQKDGKDYVHDRSSPGYYGLIVDPGSEMDNTMGKTGIHWEYLQYADGNDALVKTLRSLLPDFRAAEDAEDRVQEEKISKRLRLEDERIDRLVKTGLCPKCGTWCYGDCEA